MFSVGASKLAAKATESALRFGEIASQKVVQVSETVGEKVRSKNFRYSSFCTSFFGYFVGFWLFIFSDIYLKRTFLKNSSPFSLSFAFILKIFSLNHHALFYTVYFFLCVFFCLFSFWNE